MGLARSALLWVSENRTLRQTLPNYKFIRRAVSRFMPGEQLADAISAAKELKKQAIDTIFTHLGENIADEQEARRVTDHYLDVLEQIKGSGLDAYVSVKLTQLGLDLNEEICLKNLLAIVERAEKLNNMVWVDMEQSQYVDRTIALYKKALKGYPNVGLCVQAYLRRTRRDLEGLIPLAPAIRLVKGAYKEPAAIAFPKKADVNENFFELAKMLLGGVKIHRVRVGIATHDRTLIQRLEREAEVLGLEKTDYEFQLLYGIQTEEQLRLARSGSRVRSLISYGTFWFPWYIRRLAERPANVWFVGKNVLFRS